MDQLIRYRYLAAQLSTDELKSFCSKLIDNGQQELVIGGIFNSLHKQIKHDQDLSHVKTINEHIENIMEERNMNNNNNTLIPQLKPITKPITFESLPSSIINKIGSYLLLNGISKMERINRMCFVSLRYPYPALQKISTYRAKNWIDEYYKAQTINQMPLDFQQFKSMNFLPIIPDHMIQYDMHTLGRMFNKIKSLLVASDVHGNMMKY